MTDDYFADYDVYSEDSVVCILPDGIELSDGRKIIFKECVQNYHYHIGNTSDSNCIGENDRDDGSFMFYCSPHPVMIQFFDKFFSKSVQQRMNEWEKQIGEYGYSLRNYAEFIQSFYAETNRLLRRFSNRNVLIISA